MAAAKTAPSSDAKAMASKMHRRSRSGCFTCRLRRKKCEEGRPACKACKHLGLRCDYKRPMWWSNGEQRKAQKEAIKNIIKRTQLSKKTADSARQQENQQHPTSSTPPSLCHSLPTTADVFSDSLPESRDPSIDSPFPTGYDFSGMSQDGYFAMPPPPHSFVGQPPYPMFSPYEIDIKTERQVFVNDVPTRRDSTLSTFSTFQPPPSIDGAPSEYPADSWIQQQHFESSRESFGEEPVDFDFFQYPHGPITSTHEAVISVDEGDKYLLNHFLDKVLKLIFPILDANQHGSARSDVILPALETNKAYLHCCLSISATHKKATEHLSGEQVDNDIVKHRYAAISELCEALGKDEDHGRILEATLGMIFFQCSVGRPDDALPDIPWHQHFQAATSLVNKLELPSLVVEAANSGHMHLPFNMALTSWIDILGATMIGRSPVFADAYRELNLNGGSAGLAELMGCDDRIMFLISEIACLDVQKAEGLNEMMLCKYVEVLAREIGTTEPLAGSVQTCFSTTGAIRPKQLNTNMSAVFCLAARIYLCGLVPGFSPTQDSTRHLVAHFAQLMEYIPAGPEGFDRSLSWPLLIAGAVSLPDSPFRAMFAERCSRLGEAADFGSFGRIHELLRDIWQLNDPQTFQCETSLVHWRDVMQQKGWDVLLI